MIATLTGHSAVATARSIWAGAHGVSALPTLNRSPILIDFAARFLSLSNVMRLLAELVIIAALIFLGWNKPFKDQVAQANRTITTKLHGVGSKLQKHQDPSVRRY